MRDKLTPVTAKRFSSLPDVRRVDPAILASVSAAETLLIRVWTSALVYPSIVSVITLALSVIAATVSSPAVLRRRTVVPSNIGMPVPDALVSKACPALRSGVNALVSVKALVATDIEAATSAALTAETPMLTFPCTILGAL